ncbi:MAG: hypothetical protein M3Q22_09450 [Actinomycetota bacterium]|nr:hypothetical protein [Actinomycetota bacterium]
MSMLAELVEVAPDGYAELYAFAEQHLRLRAWAMEGSGGYGAGLAEHLAQRDEMVIELDRPVRPKRRAGAKSDPIDAVRAARDALARTHLAQPKTGAERAALQMHLTARRAAVEAGADAQRQLHALVVTAPERVRAKFRGQSTRLMISTASTLRAPRTSDAELTAAVAGATCPGPPHPLPRVRGARPRANHPRPGPQLATGPARATGSRPRSWLLPSARLRNEP